MLELRDILMLAAMAPPGGGRNHVTGRFLRHFNLMAIDAFDEECMKGIFLPILDWHFARGFEANQRRFARILVHCTADLYQRVVSAFLPTPSKSHYLFNLRDFSRVVQGVLLLSSAVVSPGGDGSKKIIRAWVHEVYRVFYDRLVDEEDRAAFFKLIKVRFYFSFKIYS